MTLGKPSEVEGVTHIQSENYITGSEVDWGMVVKVIEKHAIEE